MQEDLGGSKKTEIKTEIYTLVRVFSITALVFAINYSFAVYINMKIHKI